MADCQDEVAECTRARAADAAAHVHAAAALRTELTQRDTALAEATRKLTAATHSEDALRAEVAQLDAALAAASSAHAELAQQLLEAQRSVQDGGDVGQVHLQRIDALQMSVKVLRADHATVRGWRFRVKTLLGCFVHKYMKCIQSKIK